MLDNYREGKDERQLDEREPLGRYHPLMQPAAAVALCLMLTTVLTACSGAASGDQTACSVYFEAIDDLDTVGDQIKLAADAGEEISRATAEHYIVLDAAVQQSVEIAYDKAEDGDLVKAFSALRGVSALEEDGDARLARVLAIQNAADRCRAVGVGVTYDVRTNAPGTD